MKFFFVGILFRNLNKKNARIFIDTHFFFSDQQRISKQWRNHLIIMMR